MTRTTIDYGIDLGTTNSAIAVLRGTIPDIIKNNDDHDITPSALFIDKRGQCYVGQRAKNRQGDKDSQEDVYLEFKRNMGTDFTYQFKTSGRSMRPEDLSVEVLKSLRGDVQQRFGEDIQCAVITVPAAFEARQCVATRKAGELAGFLQCPLLQEPVAAALAYGFQKEITKEYWLVYDFGGGTFDAAVIKIEDGSITVVNHGGDNYLGGSDIDWAVVENLIIPELENNYNFPGISRSNKKWRFALARIKNQVEGAKVLLSRSESAFLECKLEDAEGQTLDFEYKLSRNALIDLAEPLIMRSVDICKRVMKEKNLSPAAIGRVILVGGPTLAPYFREMLKANLDIFLDHSVDPLTVVARGAAVFAGTQRLEGIALPKASAGQYNIKLAYKTMGPDTDPQVRGEVTSADASSIQGFSIEFVNRTPEAKELIGWRSGKIALREDGKFKAQLKAEKGFRNTYAIELLDQTGRQQITVPENVVYTVTGAAGVVSEQPIINSIAVALANNEPLVFFKKGDPLPAKATHVCRSTHVIKKGQSGDVLKVPVVEGEVELADRNRLLGSLEITGTNIRRDIPAGTEVEITLHMDASRIIRAKAYIPMLDEEYEAAINYNTCAPKYDDLKAEYEGEVARIESLKQKTRQASDAQAGELLDNAENGDATAQLDGLIAAAKADAVAANQAEKRLLELKMELDKAEDLLKWPALVAEANQAIDALDKLIADHGSDAQESKAGALRADIETLIAQKRVDKLKKKIEHVLDLHREILFEQPGFWVGYFQHLQTQKSQMVDQQAAERLVAQGLQHINTANLQGLRNVVIQLLNLLPEEVAEAVQRGYQSGLLK